MHTISIAARFGPFVSSRGSARALRGEVVRFVGAGSNLVVLDFAGIESVSDSFSDELIAVLVQQRGVRWVLQHVRIVNLASEDRRDVEQVVKRRAGAVNVTRAFG